MDTTRLPDRIARMLSTPRPRTGCVEWMGQRSHNGYGRVWLQGRWAMAHRAVWVLTGRAIPAGLVLDHKCQNPHCVNPAHLQAITPERNRALVDERRPARAR